MKAAILLLLALAALAFAIREENRGMTPAQTRQHP